MTNGKEHADLIFRQLRVADHSKIIEVMPSWWGGRDLTHMVPRLFAVHFNSTSFVIEDRNQLVGFLIGFHSQSQHDESYIHFVGIHPEYRGQKLGAQLYSRFFELCKNAGRAKVRCCTSPVNRGSITFHEKMGFELEPGTGTVDGYPVSLDHNKPGDHKVQFLKSLI